MLLSYTSIIITKNNLIHRVYKMVSYLLTHYTLHITNNVDTRDPMSTSASSGSVSTQHFGEQFDAAKVETGPLIYGVTVYPPASVRKNPNVTLYIDIILTSCHWKIC